MLVIFFLSFTIFIFMKPEISFACMTVLVGRNASETGEILVAHNEDAPGRFIMQTHLVHKKRRGAGKTRKFEPDLAEIELYETRTNLFWSEAKTYSKNYSDSAFCDFYVNGHGVVICSNNCAYSKEDSPELYNGGIGYGLRRLVAERAHSAAEAVEIAASLVEKYGYASSGRSYAFSDKDEIFVMQIVYGKHYAIARVPDDEVCVIPNHYTIHEPDRKARGYRELVDYAIKRGWYDPQDGAFDFKKVYQSEKSFADEKNTHRHVRAFEILLDIDLSALLEKTWEPLPFSIKPSKKVSIDTLKKILRTHFENTSSCKTHGITPHFSKPLTVCNCDTLESTIAQIRHNPDRIILRRALGRPCFAPYVVWYSGIIADPEGYEDTEPEEASAKHFDTTPEDMDYKNNAWFRTMEIQAACDILYAEKSSMVREKIHEFEGKIERELKMLDPQIELRLRNEPDIARAMMEGAVMSWTKGAKELAQNLRSELNIIHAEALSSIIGSENFRIRIHNDIIKSGELNISGCKCGPSYKNYSDWSECAGINDSEKYIELEFSPGKWFIDSVPCFNDMYMILETKTGKKYAGCVKIQVRKI